MGIIKLFHSSQKIAEAALEAARKSVNSHPATANLSEFERENLALKLAINSLD